MHWRCCGSLVMCLRYSSESTNPCHGNDGNKSVKRSQRILIGNGGDVTPRSRSGTPDLQARSISLPPRSCSSLHPRAILLLKLAVILSYRTNISHIPVNGQLRWIVATCADVFNSTVQILPGQHAQGDDRLYPSHYQVCHSYHAFFRPG